VKDSNVYVIGFAAGFGIVCALLLTAVAESTEPRREANKNAEKQLNIFPALGVPFDKKASAEELGVIYTENVKQQVEGDLTLRSIRPRRRDQGPCDAFRK